MPFPKATFDSVFNALVAGFDGVRLATGDTLHATGAIFDPGAIAATMLPALSFQEGNFTSSEWQTWVQLVKWTLPGILYVPANYVADDGAKIRQVVADLYLVNSMIKGLPVDDAGNLVRYSPETARLVDDEQVGFLVNRAGPVIAAGAVTRSATAATALVALSFALEFYLENDPRVMSPMTVLAVGLTPLDPARRTVPDGWTAHSPPADRDRRAWGMFSDADPVGDMATRLDPPFPDSAPVEPESEGNDPASIVASLSVVPRSLSLGVGATLALAAIATALDDVTQNVSPAALWASNAPGVATVSAAGVVTGVAPGTATITATFLSATSACSVTVA